MFKYLIKIWRDFTFQNQENERNKKTIRKLRYMLNDEILKNESLKNDIARMYKEKIILSANVNNHKKKIIARDSIIKNAPIKRLDMNRFTYI